MFRRITTVAAALLMMAAGAAGAQEPAAADDGDSWIHVRVHEADGAEVEVDLPLSLVDVALEMGQEEGFDADDLRFGEDSGVRIEDLRRMWRQLRDAGDADFVDVRDGDERVRVFRRGDRVRVDVHEEGRQKVRVDVPARVVDALLGTDEERLDLPAAARELAKAGDREVVRIEDDGTRIRIWVDRRTAAAADG